jgi:four helix bundle protein
MAQRFQDLTVWQRAVKMAVGTYAVTKCFPSSEIYGLTSQMRRAAVSVASNIAEGRGRLTEGEFRQFLGQAQGSNCELQTQIEVARHLRFATEEQLNDVAGLSVEVGKMLSALIGSLAKRVRK